MNKKKLCFGIIGVVAVAAISVGLTYSYFAARVNEVNKTQTKMKIAELDLTFTGTTEIVAENVLPGDSFTKTFNVENPSSKELTYNIYMENIVNEIGDDIVFKLEDDNGVIIEENDMPKTNAGKKYILKKVSIPAQTTINYVITVKVLDKKDEDQSYLFGKEFNGTLGIDTNYIPTGAEILAKTNEVKPSSIINFSQVSSDINGKGLYVLDSTVNNDNPIYFFRGDVLNNNVKFGNYCWLIVRTTDTGGIRMVYNGAPNESGECKKYNVESKIGDIPYSGISSDYKTDSGVNSTLKGAIDTWYYNNLIQYEKYIDDSVYCNEADGKFPKERWSSNDEPKLSCLTSESYTVSSEKGNGKLTYPIAVLTVDEYVLAGAAPGIRNSSFYLYNGLQSWTLTSGDADGHANAMCAYAINAISCIEFNYSVARPAITLKNTVELIGTGTTTDPYVVE